MARDAPAGQPPAAQGINVGPLQNVKFSGLLQVWFQGGDAGFVDTGFVCGFTVTSGGSTYDGGVGDCGATFAFDAGATGQICVDKLRHRACQSF